MKRAHVLHYSKNQIRGHCFLWLENFVARNRHSIQKFLKTQISNPLEKKKEKKRKKMASVIKFSDECIEIARNVKARKSEACIFSVDEGNCKLDYYDESPKKNVDGRIAWEEFINHLPKNKCAYGLTHITYISPADKVERSKLVFVLWAPDVAKIKEKMVISFSANGVIGKIGGGGISCRLEGNSVASVTYDEALEHALARSTVK